MFANISNWSLHSAYVFNHYRLNYELWNNMFGCGNSIIK